MQTLRKLITLLTLLVIAPAAACAASGPSNVGGTWSKLPAAPFSVLPGAAIVWTGKQVVVLGRQPSKSTDVGLVYDPGSRTWTPLSPPQGPDYVPGYRTVWTGKEMLAFDPFYSVAYNPRTGMWRKLRKSINLGFVAWTGREAIGWGGGCCGDAQSNGTAYDPSSNTYRNLPRSPLAPSQGAVGAWTSHELILFISGLNPANGKPYAARFARAAAYNPTTNAWRRLAPIPAQGGTSVWDGHELLVVGAGSRGRSAYAYNPTTNGWRGLAPLPYSANGAAGVWTGKEVLLSNSTRGLLYNPATNRWGSLPRSPLRARSGSTVIWTGRSLIVWGGEIGTPIGTAIPPKFPLDGAMFTPKGRTP